MKAVFVIDVDKDELGEAVATITAEENDITFFARGVIRPLPSKLVPFGYLDVGNEDGLYEKGYNDCIDEITGETE